LCQAFRGLVLDMTRKSSITTKPKEVRATIDKLVRQGSLTLDAMRDYIAEKHGEQNTPSRSALGRYSAQQEEMLKKMRAIDAAARVVVEELGESPDDRAGSFLLQSITTLANDAAMRAQTDGEEKTSIEDIRKLARMARDLISARTIDMKQRQAIEAMARERLIAEQSGALDNLVKTGEASQSAVDIFRKEILGLKTKP